ncbi:phosphate starvation-inducible protein PhoH, partial [candidate division KSB3 bacterium]
PYVRYMEDLLAKLHKKRSANKLFVKDSDPPKTNPRFFEMMPLNYMRGMNIDDAIVILDEVQNISRDELRLALTRMGENTRCFCLGDTSQVDNPHLNSQNNGLNWMVKKFKGDKRYAHIVLNGGSQVRSRGPVTDLVIETDL